MKAKEQSDSNDCRPSSVSTNSTRPPNRYSDEERPESPENSPDEAYGAKLKLNENAK